MKEALTKCKAAFPEASTSSGSATDAGSGLGGNTGGGQGGTTGGGHGGQGGTTSGGKQSHEPEHPPDPPPAPPIPLPRPRAPYGQPPIPGPGPGDPDPVPTYVMGGMETHTVTAKSFIMGSSGGTGDIHRVPGNAPESPGPGVSHGVFFGVFLGTLPSEDPSFCQMGGDMPSYPVPPHEGYDPIHNPRDRHQRDYRLFSEKKAEITCVNNIVKSAREKEPRSDVGDEPVGAGIAKGFDKEDFIWVPAFVFQTWRFKGIPGEWAERLIQLAGSRTSNTIWHQVRAMWICREGKSLLCAAQLCGSKFPTHRMWHDGQTVCTLPQGEVTDLWYPSPESSSLVLPHPQCCEKKK
jgi:hypothetical protein